MLFTEGAAYQTNSKLRSPSVGYFVRVQPKVVDYYLKGVVGAKEREEEDGY